MSLVFPSSLVTVHSLRWLTHLCERSTINLVNSQIGNHLEYKSRSTYESNNIDWALLNVDTFFIIVEILWLHIKLICKVERIGGGTLYVHKWNEHWIPFIYDLRMLWSPVQNFESALGISATTRSLSISSQGPEIYWKSTRVGTCEWYSVECSNEACGRMDSTGGRHDRWRRGLERNEK